MFKKKIICLCLIGLLGSACSLQTTKTDKTTTLPDVANSSSSSGTSQASQAVTDASAAAVEALKKDFDGKALPGVHINGVDVSGLKEAEIEEKLKKELMDPLSDRKVLYSYANIKDYMSYKRLKVALDPAVIQEALSLAGKLSPKELEAASKGTFKKELTGKLTYDEEYLAENIAVMNERIQAYSRQKSLEGAPGSFKPKVGATLKVVDEEKAQKAFQEIINFSKKNPKRIDVPTKDVPLDYSAKDLESVQDVLGSYTTKYKNSVEARKFNIALAGEKINNSLLMPGQEFSFNQSLGGGASSKNGFAESGVYSGLNLVQEPGGGVCQVSSTIYCAVLDVGLEPTERHNHGMTVSYLPEGMDAVVYAPDLDFKFKNTFDQPIVLQVKADGKKLKISILGDEKLLDGKTYHYESEVYETDPAVIEEVEDDAIPKGAIVLDPSPHDGIKAKVVRIIKQDGEEISRELFSDDTYKRSDGVRRTGTGDLEDVPKEWYLNRKVEQYPEGFEVPEP